MECDGCELTLEQFLAATSRPAAALRWLQRHGVLPRSVRCPTCGGDAKLEASRERMRFRCRRTVSQQPLERPRAYHLRRCEFARSAREGTWCGNATASLPQICRFCAVWLLEGGAVRARLEADFNPETATRWLCYCREVLVGWAVRNAQRVGGRRRVVEVEAAPVRQDRLTRFCELRAAWAVGGVEPGSGRAFLVPLEGRWRRSSLWSALRGAVQRSSTLASALWEACGTPAPDQLPGVSFLPRSLEAEAAWRLVLGGFAPQYFRSPSRLYVGHLAEFLFRRAFPPHQRLHAFFEQVGRLFPPPP